MKLTTLFNEHEISENPDMINDFVTKFGKLRDKSSINYLSANIKSLIQNQTHEAESLELLTKIVDIIVGAVNTPDKFNDLFTGYTLSQSEFIIDMPHHSIASVLYAKIVEQGSMMVNIFDGVDINSNNNIHNTFIAEASNLISDEQPQSVLIDIIIDGFVYNEDEDENIEADNFSQEINDTISELQTKVYSHDFMYTHSDKYSETYNDYIAEGNDEDSAYDKVMDNDYAFDTTKDELRYYIGTLNVEDIFNIVIGGETSASDVFPVDILDLSLSVELDEYTEYSDHMKRIFFDENADEFYLSSIHSYVEDETIELELTNPDNDHSTTIDFIYYEENRQWVASVEDWKCLEDFVNKNIQKFINEINTEKDEK